MHEIELAQMNNNSKINQTQQLKSDEEECAWLWIFEWNFSIYILEFC